MKPLDPRAPASFEFAEIVYEKDAPVAGAARITINRPERYNAYSTSALPSRRLCLDLDLGLDLKPGIEI